MTQPIETARLDVLGDALAHPSRARILNALMDGRAFTQKELASYAGITPQTATAHLDRLKYAGLVSQIKSGRHTYTRIASEEVANALELLSTLSAEPLPVSTPPALRRARSCYNHLAGKLSVALTEALKTQGLLTEENGQFIPAPSPLWAKLGITLPDRLPKTPYAKCCLDWSERKYHIAGPLGTQLLTHALQERWLIRPKGEARLIEITPKGRRAFGEFLQLNAEAYA